MSMSVLQNAVTPLRHPHTSPVINPLDTDTRLRGGMADYEDDDGDECFEVESNEDEEEEEDSSGGIQLDEDAQYEDEEYEEEGEIGGSSGEDADDEKDDSIDDSVDNEDGFYGDRDDDEPDGPDDRYFDGSDADSFDAPMIELDYTR